MKTENKFYCAHCDRESDDMDCRDCGETCDEVCSRCNQILDNCDCAPEK